MASVTATTTYTADAQYIDGQWQATVREVPGAHTYAKTIESLRKRLREVIVLMDDRPDTDLADESAFQVGLAFSIQVTDGAGGHDSVNVTVRPGTLKGRGRIGAHVAVKGGKAIEKTTARGGRFVKVTEKGRARGSLELHGGIGKVTGRIESTLPALTGSGTLSAGAGADEAVAYAAALRERAEQAEQEAEHATRIAILVALSAGMGMRDVAAILGISYQRVSQIAAEVELEDAPAAPRRRRVKNAST